MTGTEHYREAERLIDFAHGFMVEGDPAANNRCMAEAQVHATLALAAATALGSGDGLVVVSDWDAWLAAASEWKREEVTR